MIHDRAAPHRQHESPPGYTPDRLFLCPQTAPPGIQRKALCKAHGKAFFEP